MDEDFFSRLDKQAEQAKLERAEKNKVHSQVEAHRLACEIRYLKSIYTAQGERAFYQMLALIQKKRKQGGFDYLMTHFFTDPNKRATAYAKIKQMSYSLTKA